MKNQIFPFLIVLISLLTAVSCLAEEPRLEKVGDAIVLDTHTQLMWQLGKSRKSFTDINGAKAYADGLEIGGYSDWRLPSLAERWDLLQVFIYKNNNDIKFPKQASRYWTTETDKGTLPIKLDITCMCRGDKEIEYKSKGYVRAIRGPVIEKK